MFQFRRFPAYAYLIQRTLHGYCPCGLPHSEIPGSMDICSSPRLIAACHVLRRLLMPRHSPCALYSLTYQNNLLDGSLIVELCRLSRFFGLIVFTLIFSDVVPQLNSHSLFPALSRGNLSVALLHFVIHCSVFKVQSLSSLV